MRLSKSVSSMPSATQNDSTSARFILPLVACWINCSNVAIDKMPNAGLQLRRAISIQAEGKTYLRSVLSLRQLQGCVSWRCTGARFLLQACSQDSAPIGAVFHHCLFGRSHPLRSQSIALPFHL